MEGGDFSNGFTLGGLAQLYIENLPHIYPPAPALTFQNVCSEDISIENNRNIKKWMKDYCTEYDLKSVNYLPVLTFAENVF